MKRIRHEVRFEYLYGRDAIKRLNKKPVAYLPVGCLERHGDHLPMGLDVLKAHAICCLCARKTGGVVYPAHFYSGVHFLPPDLQKRFSLWGNLYTDKTAELNLLEIIKGMIAAGAKVIVLYAGHYPDCQIKMINRIASKVNRTGKARVIPFDELSFFKTGDHAGIWETSLFAYLFPGQVKFNRIGRKNFLDHGWKGKTDPRKATFAFGRKAVVRICNFLTKKIVES